MTPLARLAELYATHRIAVSRAFGAGFFALVLCMESAQEGSLVAVLLFLAGLVLVGIATIGRLWCSLYISGYKDSRLVTAGPYSMTRNPLYFFSLLGFMGIGFATETFSLGLAFGLAFLIAYPAVIRREEAFLQSRFGSEFESYRARTPRLLPDIRLFREPESYTVNPRLFRRTMSDVVWFIWFIGIIEIVEALHELGYVKALLQLP